MIIKIVKDLLVILLIIAVLLMIFNQYFNKQQFINIELDPRYHYLEPENDQT